MGAGETRFARRGMEHSSRTLYQNAASDVGKNWAILAGRWIVAYIALGL
jgi:hypothetical protein